MNCKFSTQLPANNRQRLVNVTDNSNVGIMTKRKILAHVSHTADAKATRTTLPPKKHVNINANDQELAKVSDAKIMICLTVFFL